MPRAVLVLNSGSSSVKYALLAPEDGDVLASGLVERIGEPTASGRHRVGGAQHTWQAVVLDHAAALEQVMAAFAEHGPDLAEAGLVAVGHRVVQGGQDVGGPVLVDESVERRVEELAQLAPLHNPANLVGIRTARRLFPDLPHVAVFDTAFFRDLPEAAATYALDRDVARRYGIRRYGAHGTSHEYVSGLVAEHLGAGAGGEVGGEGLRQIVLHLGNGASASAVVAGRAVDTSMGLTPLEGLVMGSRTGDIDAATVFHLSRVAGMDVAQIDDLLNRRSGLLGLAGANDMREVRRREQQGDPDARLALDVYVHRLRSYIGRYAAVMGGLDALTFTAGVGEHNPWLRARCLAGLGFLGMELDDGRNEGPVDGLTVVSSDSSRVTVLVVPTNEELAIARQALDLLGGPSCRTGRTSVAAPHH